MKLVAFCESSADFQVARDLVDRVLEADGPTWVRDNAEHLRSWLDDEEGHAFYDIHHVLDHAAASRIKVPYGYFNGAPGRAMALTTRTACYVARARLKRDEIDGVLIVIDMDDEPVDRRAGMEQARIEARGIMPFAIVLGAPNIMREAWVLAGFDPVDDAEQVRFDELRAELGFRPSHDSHRLDSNDENAKRSPKRVLWKLTERDVEREAKCWRDAPLETLRERGEHNGLRAFLGEIKTHLVPLLGAAQRS